MSPNEFDAIAEWGANVIRLPFCQARVFAANPGEAELYLEALDQIIDLAALRGMYTILDLQWLDHTAARGTLAGGRSNFVPPLPDARTPALWSLLADRYSKEPAVLYDLLNEPHDPLPDDPGELISVGRDGTFVPQTGRRVGFPEWIPWAIHLTETVRSRHPEALVLISGIDWGYDLSGFPIAGLDNVIYSTHIYPSKKKRWKAAFGKLSERYPVFVGEWGGTAADLDWGRKLAEYLDELQLGWTAWSWCDHPRLTYMGSDYRPTPFGELVREKLRFSA